MMKKGGGSGWRRIVLVSFAGVGVLTIAFDLLANISQTISQAITVSYVIGGLAILRLPGIWPESWSIHGGEKAKLIMIDVRWLVLCLAVGASVVLVFWRFVPETFVTVRIAGGLLIIFAGAFSFFVVRIVYRLFQPRT